MAQDIETVTAIVQQYIADVQYDKDLLIEPNAFPLSELGNDNPFVKEVLRTGKEIYWE